MSGAVLPPCYLFCLWWPSPEVCNLYGRATVSMVGLMVTSFKRTYTSMPCLPGLLLPVPLSLWQAIADPRLHKRPSNSHRDVWHYLLMSLLLSTGCWCKQVYFFASSPRRVSGTLPTVLLGLLLCLWIWSIHFWWFPTSSSSWFFSSLLLVTPGITWLLTFAFQFPMIDKRLFFGISSKSSRKSPILTGEDERTSFYSAILNKVSPSAHLMC